MKISVGSRCSPLALAQVEEVLLELKKQAPHIEFEIQSVKTIGDRDRATSLRTLDKTDFFTREIDEMQLSGKCRISIHSAKDLPDPLPQGLAIAAITKGVDSGDALVLKEGTTLENLKAGALIATSSQRREESVHVLRHDFCFCDLRGTISERLALLDQNKVDGVVVAEAALIRLGLTHLNRVPLPGKTVPFQGQLAILAREEDVEMKRLFSALDSRQHKRVLYTGLEPPESIRGEVHHCPLIQIVPKPFSSPDVQDAFSVLSKTSHLIFTSKTAVTLFCDQALSYGISKADLNQKMCVVVGKSTAQCCIERGFKSPFVASKETAEGVVELLSTLDLKRGFCLWPHAGGARLVIRDYLMREEIPFFDYVLYETHSLKPHPLPSLIDFEEIVFTSPSTIDAFVQIFGSLPSEMKLSCIGPVTEAHLKNYIT